MATNFPTSVDSFTNPTAVDTLDSPPHDQQHADVNDAMEAVQTALLDGAPLHIDDANERVGIGTTSPAEELHIAKDQNADLTQILIENLDQRVRVGSYYESGVGQYGKIQSENDGGAALALALNPSGGNVGINDTSPSYTLDVDGDINATGDLRIGGTAIGEWTAFTPSWFSVTVGNATQKAYYAVVNGIVHVVGEFVFGSTSAFTTSGVGFLSPVTVNSTVMGNFTGVGQVIVNGNQFGFAQRYNTDIYFYWLDTGAATRAANMPNMNATGPKTFTTGDDIRWYLTYATT